MVDGGWWRQWRRRRRQRPFFFFSLHTALSHIFFFLFLVLVVQIRSFFLSNWDESLVAMTHAGFFPSKITFEKEREKRCVLLLPLPIYATDVFPKKWKNEEVFPLCCVPLYRALIVDWRWRGRERLLFPFRWKEGEAERERGGGLTGENVMQNTRRIPRFKNTSFSFPPPKNIYYFFTYMENTSVSLSDSFFKVRPGCLCRL